MSALDMYQMCQQSGADVAVLDLIIKAAMSALDMCQMCQQSGADVAVLDLIIKAAMSASDMCQMCQQSGADVTLLHLIIKAAMSASDMYQAAARAEADQPLHFAVRFKASRLTARRKRGLLACAAAGQLGGVRHYPVIRVVLDKRPFSTLQMLQQDSWGWLSSPLHYPLDCRNPEVASQPLTGFQAPQRVLQQDSWVVVPIASVSTPGHTMEGTRLTLVKVS
eukprot:907730-Pelagomonas_calceolata.AAC.2